MTAGLENTASRAAPANTQQRASSQGRSMKTQSNNGFFLALDSLRPSNKQVFQPMPRQATLGAWSASISAFNAAAVGAVVGSCAAAVLDKAKLNPALNSN